MPFEKLLWTWIYSNITYNAVVADKQPLLIQNMLDFDWHLRQLLRGP